MAKKRMFNLSVLDTDAFLSMPLSAQAMYFHLNLRADDDGFVGNPQRIRSYIGASEDDLNLLIAKKFLLKFEDGIVVIKHWRMHNTLSNNRYQETQYQDQKAMLLLKSNKSYSFNSGTPLNDAKYVTMHNSKNGGLLADKRRTNGGLLADADKDIDIDSDKDSDKGLDKDSDLGLVNTNAQSSGEPSHKRKHPKPQGKPFITLTLNTGEEYPIYPSDLSQYKELYPAVDVEQQFRSMKGWCLNNPTKRKTKNGIKRFVNSWLSREQDKFHPSNDRNYRPTPGEVLERAAQKYRSGSADNIVDEKSDSDLPFP